MAGVLDGLKVVDMGQVAAIPVAGAWMADWGAEVIKVEPPVREMTREVVTDRGADYSRFNPRHQLYDRNKKSLAVDLKKEAGRDILYKLIKRSDVFMSNYEVGALKRLKADYASLREINPRLIYAVITGFGTVGPEKDERGYDATATWARSGLMYMLSEPGAPPPFGGTMDKAAAGYAVAGICAALLRREQTGKGQELELSLYQTGVWINSTEVQTALAIGSERPKNVRTKAANPLANNYRTKDDQWLVLYMMQSGLFWPDFCRAIEKPGLENDPRFNNMEARTQNCEELVRIIDEVFASKNREEWEKRFKENNCIYSRVETPLDVIINPQALANDFFAEIDHPTLGKIKLVASPVKFHEDPASVRTPAPDVGQNTEEILLDLGYSREDIAELKEQGENL